MFDAYLIVLSALEAICEANHVVNETKLVNELHASTIQMYDDNLIKELPSCLKELIETALRRFNDIWLKRKYHCTFSKLSDVKKRLQNNC